MLTSVVRMMLGYHNHVDQLVKKGKNVHQENDYEERENHLRC